MADTHDELRQFFGDPWTAFETENMLVTMLLQDAAEIGPTLDFLISAAFSDTPSASSLRSRAQFRILSALHRIFKLLRHDTAGPVRHVVPPAATDDSRASYAHKQEQVSTLGEQLEQIEANMQQLRQYMDQRAQGWIQVLVAAVSSRRLAGDAAWVGLVALLKDWIRYTRSRRMDEHQRVPAFDVVLVCIPEASRIAVESNSAPLARKLISLIRALISSIRLGLPLKVIHNTCGSALTTLSRFCNTSWTSDDGDPCEIIIEQASVDPDCRALLIIAHLELALSLALNTSTDAPCPTCSYASDKPSGPFPPTAALNLMSVNDKHLVHFLLAHLALSQIVIPARQFPRAESQLPRSHLPSCFIASLTLFWVTIQ
ncbi:hypothetical protein BCR44DRAFT_1250171 [Catenaria anguillulae PL171]|uniref:Uncharacterized protein n=1 Tax=Catenaria anguillulae PL171 TaxID=765915 RepID=A0A1Y2I0T2_9FUNG|nr:hypothetical protein BCR44DRAFT_1250171 [Catenaria anguillulae PL171]